MAAGVMTRQPALGAARMIAGERLHLQHGPIDVILKAWGETRAVEAAYRAVIERFGAILEELVSDLIELRRPMAENPCVATPVARRMTRACAPFASEFITPMAAVAGSVADELLDVMRRAASLDRAFANNGGDIAVHVADGHSLTTGLVADMDRGLNGALDGSIRIDARSGVGGVATSGWPGRSFSFGIADAVTVLARGAASADAAATMIANAVNVESAAVRRARARDLDPDSDLGDRLVTVDVGVLSESEIETALASGIAKAQDYQRRELIIDAALSLKGQMRTLSGDAPSLASSITFTSSAVAELDPATKPCTLGRAEKSGSPDQARR